MGYRCPVCDAPQADGRHLANHLAFTAMLHGDGHEAWLDEHAEGWSTGGPRDLIPRVTAHAEEIEFETVFDDTTGGHDHAHDHGHGPGDDREHEHGHARGHDHGHGDGPDLEGAIAEGPGYGRAPMDDEAREILDEAREMTERMYDLDEDDDADGNEAEAGEADGGEADGGAKGGDETPEDG